MIKVEYVVDLVTFVLFTHRAIKMSYYVCVFQFPLDGLKLDLDPAILRGRTKDIIGFLNQKLKRVRGESVLDEN